MRCSGAMELGSGGWEALKCTSVATERRGTFPAYCWKDALELESSRGREGSVCPKWLYHSLWGRGLELR